jgi:hypothetical protein
MPKDAAYYELLVPSRRVQRDTSGSIIITKALKIKSEIREEGSLGFCRESTVRVKTVR